MKNKIDAFCLPLKFILVCSFATSLPVMGQESATPTLTEVWRLDKGFKQPESVIYDPQRDVLYVSNINGEGVAKDNNGYISTVSLEGKLIKQDWSTGMHGLKGLALFDSKLYAADVDGLVEIDTATGKILHKYLVDNAGFLNDVAVNAAGHVFLSDSHTSKVHKLENGELSDWISGPAVGQPNGVFNGGEHLLLAAGDSIDANGQPVEKPGKVRYLKTVDYKTGAIAPLANTTPLGGIDAIEADGRGGYFLSDWGGGTVSHFTAEKGLTILLTLNKGTADLTYRMETQMLYLPLMVDGALVAYKVEWK